MLRFPRAASTITMSAMQGILAQEAQDGRPLKNAGRWLMLGCSAFADMPFSWGPLHNEVLQFPAEIAPDHPGFKTCMNDMHCSGGFGVGGYRAPHAATRYYKLEKSWVETFNTRTDTKKGYDPDKLTFQIVRNPFDWMISIYSYDFMGLQNGRGHTYGNFKEFVKFVLDPDMKYADWSLKTKHPFPWPMMKRCFFQGFDNDDNCKVDAYIRYEDFQEGLTSLLELGGDKLSMDLRNTNLAGSKSKRTNSTATRSYKDYKDEFYADKEIIEVIREAYAWDLENFNYDFNGLKDNHSILIPGGQT